MAHTVNLRLFVCRTVRPGALHQPSPFHGQIAGLSNQWRATKGRWVQSIRAEHHEPKTRKSGVTRASASGSSFRDASDALSQAQPGKGLEATPELGVQAHPLQVILSLTCLQSRLPRICASMKRSKSLPLYPISVANG